MKYLFLIYTTKDKQDDQFVLPEAIFSTQAKARAWLKAKKLTEKTATVYRVLRDPLPSVPVKPELVTCWQTWKDGE